MEIHIECQFLMHFILFLIQQLRLDLEKFHMHLHILKEFGLLLQYI